MKPIVSGAIIAFSVFFTAGLLSQQATNNDEREWIVSRSTITSAATNYTKLVGFYDAGKSQDGLYRIMQNENYPIPIIVPVTIREIYNSADPITRAKLLRASYEWRNEDSTNVMTSPAWSMTFSNGLSGPCMVTEVLPGGIIGRRLEVVHDRTNHIKQLIQSGEFCSVVGHSWGSHMHVTLEYMPNRIGCRECSVCKMHQEQFATEWK